MRAPRRMIWRLAAVLATAVAAPALAGGYGHYGYGIHYSHHGHGNQGVALLAGLVIGGLAGYMISEDRQRQRAYYRAPGYYPAPPPRRQATVAAPLPAPTTTLVRGEFRDCVMTREYTSRIEVDGRSRDAYGTKCLRADGSWELGRLKLAPEFD